jgi:DNA-binding SARP family transcriptional activator/tetratricopeptide (TPR) repeat protein
MEFGRQARGSLENGSVIGMLTVELLGPPCARRDGEEISLGPARQRAVFAALAMRANAVVSRQELIDAVWGEKVPASAQGIVYTYISSLRRSLDPARSSGSGADQVLASAGSGYSLRLPRGGVDVQAFEEFRARAQEQHDAGSHEQELRLLEAALDLWHGEALSGIPGPYAASQRQRLSELRVATLERRAEARLALGGHLDLATELADLVSEHPMRESLRRLQMLALYRSGRPAEALEVYRETRRVLRAELGIEPSPALRQLQQQILANDTSLNPEVLASKQHVPTHHRLLSVVPSGVSTSWDGGPVVLLGRDDEIATLQGLLADLAAGRGRAVWVEGESGIGKSELLTVGLADARTFRCQLAWAAADELGRRFPLHVIRECLGAQSSAPDPRVTQLSEMPSRDGTEPRRWDSPDPTLTAIDRLLTLVEELCAEAPLAMVIDDLQWADEASLLAWHRLTGLTQRLPLLLIAASRPAASPAELPELRHSLQARGGVVISLEALSQEHAQQMMLEIIRAVPGPGLIRLADRAAGNPLYLREMFDSMVLTGHIAVVDGVADFDEASGYQAPLSLISAVSRRLAPLSSLAQAVLRVAAVLGGELHVTDVALILGRPPSSLLAPIDEVVEAKVLVEAGARLAFRHPLLRQALYEGMSLAMRVALHREAAEVLASAGTPADRVARLLVAVPVTVDPWLVEWLSEHHPELMNRAPAIDLELLQRVLQNATPADPQWEGLTSGLARVLYALGEDPEAPARRVLARTTNPSLTAEMRYLLASALYRRGSTEQSVQTLREATQDPAVPAAWRARQQSLLARYLCSGSQDLDAAQKAADEAIVLAEPARDPFSIAHALKTLCLINAVRRDHQRSLEYRDRAIEVVRNTRDLVDVHFDLLDTRMFCLQNLDRLPEATDVIHTARELFTKYDVPSRFGVSAAVHYYWTGQWDEALAELQEAVAEAGPEVTFGGLRERTPPIFLLHGVAALIAGHRGVGAEASAHLDAAAKYPVALNIDRENCDFLFRAQALAAEDRGLLPEALSALDPVLSRRYAPMMLRHQWLPELARIALAADDRDRAHAALEVCAAEAELEVVPARALAAMQRCRGLLAADPAPLLEAAEHYRRVGRVVELAQTLEDAAALLAERDGGAARETFEEAVAVYGGLGAAWDIRRSEARLGALGIH